MEIRVKLLHRKAQSPKRGSPQAAGYDLFTPTPFIIGAGERQTIPLGIATEIPEGWYGDIGDRSGLAHKNGITVLAGKIDSDYRGEWGVILLNTGPHLKIFEAGDRIAQVIFLEHGTPSMVEGDLSNSKRGSGGFGSTGE